MSSRDGYRKDTTKFCCEQCRMMEPTCDVCKTRNRELKDKDATIAALKAELAEAKSDLHDVCLECKDWEYNYGRLCKSYAKITGELAECRGKVEKVREYLKERGMKVTPGYYGVPLIHEDVLDDLEEILK